MGRLNDGPAPADRSPMASPLVRSRTSRSVRWVLPLVLTSALVFGACSDPAPDVAIVRADDVVLAYVDSGLSADVADCFVGLGQREFELGDLLPGAAAEADRPLIDEMLASCESAVAILAADEPPPPSLIGIGPFNVGDDMYLDELWTACDRGDGAACDELWAEAPVGSIYESFGVTCGGRPELLDCGVELVPEVTEPSEGGDIDEGEAAAS